MDNTIQIKDYSQREVIKQRLMYSFGFTYEQAENELTYLFATATMLHTFDYYTIYQKRFHAKKLLDRKQKQEIYKYVVAILSE